VTAPNRPDRVTPSSVDEAGTTAPNRPKPDLSKFAAAVRLRDRATAAAGPWVPVPTTKETPDA
jgi:hypothetical protein